jgi:glyoxylate/hydroxypyruvate reductase A
MKQGAVLFAVTGWDASGWIDAFRARAPSRLVLTALDDPGDPAIHYATVWKHKPGMLSRLPNLRAIFSLGAGVDHIFTDSQLPDVPIVRIVADDLTARMSEYVVWQVLDHHRHGRLFREQQRQRRWRHLSQPAAASVTVGIMGLGVLGKDAAEKLQHLGFKVAGWSRTIQQLEGVSCFAGADGLQGFLAISDIVVVLLPLTAQTRGIVDRRLIDAMKRKTPLGGPVLINAGRGGLQVDSDILSALNDGRLMAVSLDVFETEPLPAESPLWRHPHVTITPHAAADSDPSRLVPLILEQMEAFERGEPLRNVVDRAAGY